ncbi:alpha-hydroxy-acid oxidizing protein [Saccharospirillum mangrovi]|nr:alpha-hydroxy-acid oxidizing protein [Saccharospirillum mangrovi]
MGAAGERGVTDVLNILHKELDISMALCGERDIRNVGKHNLVNPDVFS